jgi:hypothetical protein
MIPKHAIMLAIILGNASGTLAATHKQHSINPAFDGYINEMYNGSDPDPPKSPGQSGAGPSTSVPIMQAQGRCYNNHCY